MERKIFSYLSFISYDLRLVDCFLRAHSFDLFNANGCNSQNKPHDFDNGPKPTETTRGFKDIICARQNTLLDKRMRSLSETLKALFSISTTEESSEHTKKHLLPLCWLCLL